MIKLFQELNYNLLLKMILRVKDQFNRKQFNKKIVKCTFQKEISVLTIKLTHLNNLKLHI